MAGGIGNCPANMFFAVLREDQFTIRLSGFINRYPYFIYCRNKSFSKNNSKLEGLGTPCWCNRNSIRIICARCRFTCRFGCLFRRIVLSIPLNNCFLESNLVLPYICNMFNDKKLRNTFSMAVLAVVLPTLYWVVISNTGHLESTLYWVEIGICSIACLLSLYAIIRVIKNWKAWDFPVLKICIILISIIGILVGLFFIHGSWYLINYFIGSGADAVKLF